MKILLVLLMSFTLTPAFAINENNPNCKEDIQKFCKDIQPGKGRIVRCLKEHKNELSEGCKERGEKVRAKIKDFHAACAGDLQAVCAGTKPGRFMQVRCLKKNESKISAECKDAITKEKPGTP